MITALSPQEKRREARKRKRCIMTHKVAQTMLSNTCEGKFKWGGPLDTKGGNPPLKGLPTTCVGPVCPQRGPNTPKEPKKGEKERNSIWEFNPWGALRTRIGIWGAPIL